MTMPSQRSKTPKGRTIRKAGSLTGNFGPVSRPTRLWQFDPEPGTLLARLQDAYMAGLDAVAARRGANSRPD